MTETDAKSGGRRTSAPRPPAKSRAGRRTAADGQSKSGRGKPVAAKAKRQPASRSPADPDAAAALTAAAPTSDVPVRRTLPWSEIRSTYEDSSLAVAVIAKAYGLRERAVYDRAAREGWAHRRGAQADAAAAADLDRPGLDRSVLVSRLFRAVERQIDEIDRRLAELQSDGVDERDARTLAALAKTLELLIGLERQTRPEVIDTPEADIDAFRRDLARRIQSLQASEGD